MESGLFTDVVKTGLDVEALDTVLPREQQPDLGKALHDINEYQRRLFANRKHSVLLVMQGLDASGKDSLIRTVAQAMDPAAFRAHNFGRPVGDEVRHDFLWRVSRHLPARGEVVAFNRSHYEAVWAERLWPVSDHCSDDWPRKYETINSFEQHLDREGTRIIKVWLNTSGEEQRKRLIKRLDTPRKRWKFDQSDVHGWQARGDYLRFVNEVLPATHTPWAPWHVIPNDNKGAARAVVAQLLADTLKELAPEYPQEDHCCIEEYRTLLTGESGQ
ncbi:polyphosphate kinase [Alcanivorax sp. S6407]|uniref:PPK2 family polyphosphate kinase n=1 Tax=Alcanivorax sp. S6407 TaxID=2926424 RepID=UPI001FF54999|nr:PPK2 family polyphosphate kinase [Alcanivorax sp. S6407]MCK0152195.1 polyphosphate kinase [Alcanivorax sp. S6407]